MSRTINAESRENAYFATRYRRKDTSPSWLPERRSDRPKIESKHQRTFAEFPLSKSWPEIAGFAQRLGGASCVGLFGESDEKWLRFTYMGESFAIQDGGNRLTLSADNGDCPESILLAVHGHYAEFLPSNFGD